MTARSWIIALSAVLIIWSACLLAGTAIITHNRCQEDALCWNCHTMGNHVCGPTAP